MVYAFFRMHYRHSYCALCGAPWFTSAEIPPLQTDEEDDEGSEIHYLTLNAAEENVEWLADYRGIGFNHNPNVQKYVNQIENRSIQNILCEPG